MHTLNGRHSDLDFEIEKSMRYHQRRRGFYESMHKSVMFAVILAGSSAIAGAPTLSAALAAILGALDLTFGFSVKARDHEILYRRFSELALDFRGTAEFTDADLRRLEAERLKIEMDEPPVYGALADDCYNEVARALGHDEKGALIPISRQRRLFMHFWRFESAAPIAES